MLGALPDRDADRVAAHAERCEHCGREARLLRPVVAKLPGDGEPPIEPPPGLKERIMAVVYAESGRRAGPARRGGPPGPLGWPGRPPTR